jgi:hypothetical protein
MFKTQAISWARIAGLLIILLVPGYYFRYFLWAKLVEPAALLLWACWRVITSVDQVVYWYILICFSVFFLLFFLPVQTERTSAYSNKQTNTIVKGAEHWQSLLHEATGDLEKRILLRRELENLFIAGLVLKENSSREVVKARLSSRLYPFPANVYAYFYPDEKNWRYRIHQTLVQSGWVLPTWMRPDKMRYKKKIQSLLQWMEGTLEAPFDEPTNP